MNDNKILRRANCPNHNPRKVTVMNLAGAEGQASFCIVCGVGDEVTDEDLIAWHEKWAEHFRLRGMHREQTAHETRIKRIKDGDQ